MIPIKSDRELEDMRVACRITAKALDDVYEHVVPGITTKELDTIIYNSITGNGASPSFLGLYDFPASACISINDEVIHGIPGRRKLKEGDIVKVDVGAFYGGFHGDAARTFPVGRISPEAERLIEITRQSFFEGVKHAREGFRTQDVSYGVQNYVEKNGFSVVREYTGHGVGAKLHEPPELPNFGSPGHGPRLLKGMTLACEPMVNAGGCEIRLLGDGWTVVTADGSLSGHYENTLLITGKESCEILTLTEKDILTGVRKSDGEASNGT